MNKITSVEVFILSIIAVFVAGLTTEVINSYFGNCLWRYTGIGGYLIFGTVTTNVLIGWAFIGVIVGLFVMSIAKKVRWGD